MEDKESDVDDFRRLLLSPSDNSIQSRPHHNHSVNLNESNNSEQHSTSSEVPMSGPEDKLRIVYVIFYILGLGTLLPWNFYITANDYWMFKLQSNKSDTTPTTVPYTNNPFNAADHNNEKPDTRYNNLQSLFQSTLSLCAMLPNVLFQFINTVLQQRISEKVRMLGSLAIMIVMFIFTEVLVKIDTSNWQHIFFAITMVSIVLLNCASAIFQSSVFGIAAGLPTRYPQAVMAGQGMGGIFASFAMVIAIAGSSNPIDSAFAYFITAIAVLLVTIVCYMLLLKNEFYKYFHRHKRTADGGAVSVNNETCHLYKENSSGNGRKSFRKDDGICGRQRSEDSDESQPLSTETEVTQRKTVPPLWMILKKIWPHCFSIFFTFTLTLSCFPAITANIRPMSETTLWETLYFTPVCCFVLFNVSDWIGRTMAGHLHLPSEKNVPLLLVLVIARIAFPALFALCNVQPRSIPVIFDNDAYFIVFILIFGISNGHLSTLCMQYGPKRVDDEHCGTAGSLLALAASLGLATGAGLSFAVKAAIV